MTKIILSTGGTGGHIFPILSLFNELKKIKEVEEIKIITDKRATKYINLDDLKVIQSESPNRKQGIFHFLKSVLIIFFSTINCLFFLRKFNPKVIVGSGGYVSFPVLLASLILGKKIFLYETNSVLGRVNKFFLPWCHKIFSGYENINNFPKKYEKKFFFSGQLLRKEFFDCVKENDYSQKLIQENEINILNILVLGGSQGAKIFDEKLPQCFKILNEKKIKFKINQQTTKDKIQITKKFYDENKISDLVEDLFDFKENILDYILKADIVICRSGSSTLSELSFLNKPFIAIPLPTSLDNHQYFNAKYYEKKNCCWVVDQNLKDFDNKIIKILEDIYNLEHILKNKIDNLKKINKKLVLDNFIKELLN